MTYKVIRQSANRVCKLARSIVLVVGINTAAISVAAAQIGAQGYHRDPDPIFAEVKAIQLQIITTDLANFADDKNGFQPFWTFLQQHLSKQLVGVIPADRIFVPPRRFEWVT